MNLVAAWPLWWLDLALAALVLEAAWLALRGRRPAAALLRDWLWCLLAGLGLLVAMRLALAGAALSWVGGSLAAAGICHALDLQARGLARQAPGRRLPR